MVVVTPPLAAFAADGRSTFFALLLLYLIRFHDGFVTASARTVDPLFRCLHTLEVPRVNGRVRTLVRGVRTDVAIRGQLTAASAVCVLGGRQRKVLENVRIKLHDLLEQPVRTTAPFVGIVGEVAFQPGGLGENVPV